MKKKHGPTFKDLTGKIFTRLTVIKFDKIWHKHAHWICRCICGAVKSVRGSLLTAGTTRSCGCLQKELNSIKWTKELVTHGLSRDRFYIIWQNMKARCSNKNHTLFPRYGGRGIKVCDRWLESFENFRDDMYESYLKHVEEFGIKETTLDRWPNVNGDYKLKNVRWATRDEQAQNTRNSAKTENYPEHKRWRRTATRDLSACIRHESFRSYLEKYLGCSLTDFYKHLEAQFTEGMTWENRGQGIGFWEIDHIIGCNNFDLSKETDRKKCFNYKNLQPLWWEDHVKKSRKRSI